MAAPATKKFIVPFRNHPPVEVDAKDEKEAIEIAKGLRGLDGIGHEMNNLLTPGAVVEASVAAKAAKVAADVPPPPPAK